MVSSQSSRELMNRALQVENKLWAILAAVRVAESEQRGYLLTGDPGYLETFRTTADSETCDKRSFSPPTTGPPRRERISP